MIPAISGMSAGLGGEWNVGSIGSIGSIGSASTPSATSPASFGGALSNALNALESTQATATTASQQLATGQATDPTKAVTAVEEASLSMDLASQISNKLVTATNTIFQTTV